MTSGPQSRIGKYNSNGELLLALCTEFDLIVTNTMFKQKDEHKTTWTHLRSQHGHMIDCIITRCRFNIDICSTRAMHGTNCGTDHQMLRGIFSNTQLTHNPRGAMNPCKAEHKQPEKHQPRGEPGAGNGQCTRPITIR